MGIRQHPAAQLLALLRHLTDWMRNDADHISGYSIRVGATQDLLALSIDLAAVMQPGRRKTNRLQMRYGEHVLGARGGMARAAAAQGMDS
jgi:hypothetical protein